MCISRDYCSLIRGVGIRGRLLLERQSGGPDGGKMQERNKRIMIGKDCERKGSCHSQAFERNSHGTKYR